MTNCANDHAFTFDGRHSRTEMGVIFDPKNGYAITPMIERNEYEISGISGTVLFPGETRKPLTFEGTLYPADEPENVMQAQSMMRRIAAWLTNGRKMLIWDREPDKYYMAQLDEQSAYSCKNWFGGELTVKFTAQPYAYAIVPCTAEGTATGNSIALTLNVVTGAPTPPVIEIENTGTAPVTGVSIGSGIAFSGLSLAAGQTLRISMEAPIGATIGGVNALQHATAFDLMELGTGAHTLTVALTYGAGTKGARIRVKCRGKW